MYDEFKFLVKHTVYVGYIFNIFNDRKEETLNTTENLKKDLRLVA